MTMDSVKNAFQQAVVTVFDFRYFAPLEKRIGIPATRTLARYLGYMNVLWAGGFNFAGDDDNYTVTKAIVFFAWCFFAWFLLDYGYNWNTRRNRSGEPERFVLVMECDPVTRVSTRAFHVRLEDYKEVIAEARNDAMERGAAKNAVYYDTLIERLNKLTTIDASGRGKV